MTSHEACEALELHPNHEKNKVRPCWKMRFHLAAFATPLSRASRLDIPVSDHAAFMMSCAGKSWIDERNKQTQIKQLSNGKTTNQISIQLSLLDLSSFSMKSSIQSWRSLSFKFKPSLNTHMPSYAIQVRNRLLQSLLKHLQLRMQFLRILWLDLRQFQFFTQTFQLQILLA